MKYGEVYTKKLKNSFSNLGQSGELKIINIMNMLQDIAVEYAIKLKISSNDLAHKHLFWVISRYQIEIHNVPKLNENLLLSIHRKAHKKLYDLRWFKIITENNKEIVNALGAWVIINKKTGSPRHLTEFMTETMLCENTTDVKQFFNNLKILHNTDYQKNFKIRINDLDLNKHVNNAIYVEWAIEALSEDILNNFSIKKINITYLKESFYPGEIISKAQINHLGIHLETYHSIIEKNKGLELARVNIIWKSL